jgi:DMSO/TMAO reductase YedYZ molybdopterin-dependent catalytic subunit
MNTPVFWAEGHPGELDREKWSIEVTGLCENPKKFRWQDIVSMQKTIADARLTSVSGFSVRGKWGGVRVSDILKLVSPAPNAKFIRFWSYRSIYDTSIPIETALKGKTILAYEFDGEFIEEDYGGPVRVFCPYLWGYKSAKSVVKIELKAEYHSGFWESRGYTDEAEIEKGVTSDVNNGGRIRPIAGGEVIKFLEE